MEHKDPSPRQPYEPPRIRKIKIAPEELAAAACKRTMILGYFCRTGSRLVNKLQGS